MVVAITASSSIHNESPTEPLPVEKVESVVSVEDPHQVLDEHIETERNDTEAPRDETNTDTPEVVEDEEMNDEVVTEILEKYAFGAGMRMYARSLALAELAEQEKTKKTTESRSCTKVDEDVAPLITVPSAHAALSFETVKSELSKMAQSLGEKIQSFRVDSNHDGIEDDDVLDIDSGLSEENKSVHHTPRGLCSADEALADLFRQAELWAEATYNSLAKQDNNTKDRSTTKKWWSFLLAPFRKGRGVETEHLTLEEDSKDATEVVNKVQKKQWWATILCEPVIVDDAFDDESTVRDDETRASTINESPQKATYTKNEFKNKSRWGWPVKSSTNEAVGSKLELVDTKENNTTEPTATENSAVAMPVEEVLDTVMVHDATESIKAADTPIS